MKRPLLLPLVPLYRAIVKSRNYAFDHEPYRTHSLKRATISVGSLSAGGAGKTPVVLALAALLTENGYTADILTRGYGRHSKAIEQVDPAGPVARFGDEPIMLARQTGLPVYVGADRLAAGQLAEQRQPGPHHLHLLDDGFQHRRLRRSVNLVLLTREDLRDTLLPAGNLREPLENLVRASVIVVREEEANDVLPFLATLPHKAAIWTIRRELHLAEKTQRAFAFCGLARPENFFTMLARSGVSLAGTMHFRDHHAYTPQDLPALLRRARSVNAGGWVVTAKDRVKLDAPMLALLQQVGPVHVAELTVTFTDPGHTLRELEAMIVKDLHG